MKKTASLLSFCLLLASCTSGPAQTTEPKIAANTSTSTESAVPASVANSSECLSPIENFDYQIGEVPPDFDWSDVQKSVLPPQEWEKIANIPDASQFLFIQFRGDETVFWIHTGSGGFVRYHVEGAKWEEGTLLSGSAEGLGEVWLFLDHQNNVFAARINKLDHGNTEALLNRYNGQTNQWEPVTIDLANQDKLAISHVEVDEQGKFWLLVRDGVEHQLYSLDPSTMTTKRYLADYKFLSTSFEISHNIIFIVAESSDPNPRYLLLRYPLDGSEVKIDYIGAPIYNNYQRTNSEFLPDSLFVDSQQRAWIGARGWLDLPTDNWHFVIPDPVFITVLGGAGKWIWDEPRITAETPDGRLWFNALRGTGWVDPKIGKWCVFTSYQSNVLLDSHDNLWLVANDWLYKHK